MKKYTSKTQKVDMYSEKYGLTKDEVNRILSEHEDVLTLEELKIKYDDMNIGVLPDWLSEDELSNMIWKTIHDYWSNLFEQRMTKEDLYCEHQIYIRKKIKQYQNHSHVKASLVKRMITLSQEFMRKGKYFCGSLDEVKYIDESSNSLVYKYEPYVSDSQSIEDDIFLENLRNIKDKQIRNLLIITGYLICDIEALRKDYLSILREYNYDIQQNILQLEEIIEDKDSTRKCDKYGNYSKRKNNPINIKQIIKALNLNANFTMKQLSYYFGEVC